MPPTSYHHKYEALYKSRSRICLTVTWVLLGVTIIALTTALGIKYAQWKVAERKAALLKEQLNQLSGSTNSIKFGTVVSGSKTCSQIGLDVMLLQNGSAMDAAIASLFCLGVVHSDLLGLGGGFFATIYETENNYIKKAVRVLDAREVAPLKATKDMFVDGREDSFTGAAAVAVPGELKGYYEAWQQYGRTPWHHLVEPSIRLCEEGFHVNGHLANEIHVRAYRIFPNKLMNETFSRDDGTPLKKGDVLKLPNLAKTLRVIAEEGATAFYDGSLTSSIINDLADCEGTSFLTEKDLNEYDVKWKIPLESHLDNGNYRLYTVPPPSSGLVLQYILNILDGYGFSYADKRDDESLALVYHRFIEASKFGFAKRSYLGDEDFVDMTRLKKVLLDKTKADATRAKITDDFTHDFKYYEPAFQMTEDSGTGSVVVLSPDGSAIAITSSLNYIFGSTCMGKRTGILFNNQMNDFATPGEVDTYGLRPAASNFIAPKKRPLSSMSPSIILNSQGRVTLAISAAGGPWITSSLIQMIIETLWLKKNPDTATSIPRLHHQLLPNSIFYETQMSHTILDLLAKRNHSFTPMTFPDTRHSFVMAAFPSFCDVTTDNIMSEQNQATSSTCLKIMCDSREHNTQSCLPATMAILTRTLFDDIKTKMENNPKDNELQ